MKRIAIGFGIRFALIKIVTDSHCSVEVLGTHDWAGTEKRLL